MAGMMYNGGNSSEEGDRMLSNMIDRLFPLLSGWNNFEGIIGAVLALLLGLWIGWDWEWKKLGVFGLSCAVIYGLGVWIEESRIMYLAVLGMCAAALMPVLILSMLAGKL